MDIKLGNQESQYRAMWREVLKHRAVEALGGKCVSCGGRYPDMIYHIHHIDPEQKEQKIFSGNVNSAKTWLKIRDELKKSVLLCPTCHMLLHAGYIDNPTNSSFQEEYYEWHLANRPSNSRSILLDLTNAIQTPEIVETRRLKLNKVEIKHFNNNQILT